MSAASKKNYAYSVEADRIIYMIHAPNCNDFFIWHCKKDLWKVSYKRHLHGQRKSTADFIKQCIENGRQPCFHILEEDHLTQVMAYRHVIDGQNFSIGKVTNPSLMGRPYSTCQKCTDIRRLFLTASKAQIFHSFSAAIDVSSTIAHINPLIKYSLYFRYRKYFHNIFN